MGRWVIAFALGAGLTGGGCVIDLEPVFACGDGYVDELAGEECDPNVPDSFLGACARVGRPKGTAKCDPDSCELITTEQQCAHCGDEIIDADEACDGSNIGAACPGGGGQPTCTECVIDFATCDACGNGAKDVGEECDWAVGGGLVIPILCAGDQPLPPPHADKPYASGTTVSCTRSCTYDRRDCDYCGDGVRDDAIQVSSTDLATTLREVCDGDALDVDALAEAQPGLVSFCGESGVVPNVACNDNCIGFTPREGDACCVSPGSECSTAAGAWKCCYELAHPEHGNACLPVLSPDGNEGDSGDEGEPMRCRLEAP